jgi:UDP-2,3-diacylglucosamine pyrophosphatase LpxH
MCVYANEFAKGKMKTPCWGTAILTFALMGLVPIQKPESPTPNPDATTPAEERLLVVISDLHMGLGRDVDGKWNPTEDFRWTGALRGFLEHISREGRDRIDLVIAGDLLELWQAHADVKCPGDGADAGCTISEMKEIVRRVIEAHKEDFRQLAAFSLRGGNRLHIIPGNHDCALLIPGIWEPVAGALGSKSGRIGFSQDGIWESSDGKIIIEHGHQIGRDVNRYKEWPAVTMRRDGQEYFIRPWGELFVQKLFNAEEREYPIIDNLIPETAGARYRMEDRGLWKSAGDIARFVVFNLFQTSLAQKAGALGNEGGGQVADRICTKEQAETMGYKLFTEALPPGDPFRRQVEGDSPEAGKLRKALDEQARSLSEEEIAQICTHLAFRKATLGGIVEKVPMVRSLAMQHHVEGRLTTHGNMAVFVYGHTHQLEIPWPLRINMERTVTVLNSGAFQRLVDEPGFLERSKKFATAQEGLRTIELDDLAPCYSFVQVRYKGEVPSAETRLWHMPENGSGSVVSPGSSQCK